MTNDELLARVEGLTGPDREVDAAIYSAVLGATVWFYDDNNHIDAQIKNGSYRGDRQLHPDFDPNPRVTWRYKVGDDYGEVPTLTASIDSAMDFSERVLSAGTLRRVYDDPDGYGVNADIVMDNGDRSMARGCLTWSLAIIAATLRALIAQGPK